MSYNKYKKKLTPKDIDKISIFCIQLSNNKVKNSKELFNSLNPYIQYLFLKEAWNVLKSQKNKSQYQINMSFLIFKLFRTKDMKKNKFYTKYDKYKTLDTYYKKADKTYKLNKSLTSVSKSKKQKKYDKKYQKYDIYEKLNGLYLFYNSLYEQKPNSKMAIRWLTIHGAYNGKKRQDLINKYEKLTTKIQ